MSKRLGALTDAETGEPLTLNLKAAQTGANAWLWGPTGAGAGGANVDTSFANPGWSEASQLSSHLTKGDAGLAAGHLQKALMCLTKARPLLIQRCSAAAAACRFCRRRRCRAAFPPPAPLC